MVNKLLFSTGHEPPRSYPQTSRPPHWAEWRPDARTASARQHDLTPPTAGDGIIVPIFIIASTAKDIRYNGFNHIHMYDALVFATGNNWYGGENALQIYRVKEPLFFPRIAAERLDGSR